MAAVGADLPDGFLDEYRAADRRSPGARLQLGKRAAGDVERQRLSRQMRVGAEVVREVVFDVRQLAVEPDEQIDDPWLAIRSRCRAGEQFQRPEPCQAPERKLQH